MKHNFSPEAGEELSLLAQHMTVARRRRRMTLRGLAERTGVSIATLSRLERGDPTVAVGTVLQVLSVLGLVKGVSRIIAPENDIEQTLHEVRELRRTKRELPQFTEEELDF
jgi:transcriptional regulator with XRE-family HTH domain